MPATYEIKFGPKGPTKEFEGSTGNYYEFEDGSHMYMNTTPVWCHGCGQITHGERIESLEEIDKKLADLNNPTSVLYRMTAKGLLNEITGGGDRLLQERLQKTKQRRTWRERRISPPKCIRCGSTDILVLPIDQPVPNPAGPGTIKVRCVGMCETDFDECFFTPEGDRIPKETTPTH